MSSDPRSWPHSFFGAALLVLAGAAALYIAAKLILAVMTVLIVTGVVVFVAAIGWKALRYRQSRW